MSTETNLTNCRCGKVPDIHYYNGVYWIICKCGRSTKGHDNNYAALKAWEAPSEQEIIAAQAARIASLEAGLQEAVTYVNELRKLLHIANHWVPDQLIDETVKPRIRDALANGGQAL